MSALLLGTTCLLVLLLSCGSALALATPIAREAAWPTGADGFTTVIADAPVAQQGTFPDEWRERQHVTADGIPFDLPPDPAHLPGTSKEFRGAVGLDLPAAGGEILLLLAADIPEEEKAWWGTPRRDPLPEPEQFYFEVRYRDGTSDGLIPFDASRGRYGVGRGVSVYALHLDPEKAPAQLILHEDMSIAAFSILAVTLNAGPPKVKEPDLPTVWYPEVKKPPLSRADFAFDASKGLTWGVIRSAMLPGDIDLSREPVFRFRIGEKELLSSEWQVSRAEWQGDVFTAIAKYAEEGVSLQATFRAERTAGNEMTLSLDLRNVGTDPVTGRVSFPSISRFSIGSVDDTWYFLNRTDPMINRIPFAMEGETLSDGLSNGGLEHPMQVDGFFSPRAGVGMAIIPHTMDQFLTWYQMAKDENGCRYALRTLPATVAPGASWETAPVAVSIVPGDWKDQLHAYQQWVSTWYRRALPPKQWFKELFAWAQTFPSPEVKRTLFEQVQGFREQLGYCDYMHVFGWNADPVLEWWGGDWTDRYQVVGGKESFAKQIREIQETGTKVGLYMDCFLVSPESKSPTREQQEAWAIRDPEGKIPASGWGKSVDMCPYVKDWQEWLAASYVKVAADTKVDAMYLDETGGNFLCCWSDKHGHANPGGGTPGETQLIARIREALPADLATYSELLCTDVQSQYLDGAICYATAGNLFYPDISPHFLTLMRFVYPDLKVIHIHRDPWSNGDWYYNRYVFFSGDIWYLTGDSPVGADEAAVAFHRNAFRIQHEYKDCFTSSDVEPLVHTEVPNLFANRFSSPTRTVYTLNNANYRTLRGNLLAVPHREGATYRDLWTGGPVTVTGTRDGKDLLSFEIGPRSIGCLVQE